MPRPISGNVARMSDLRVLLVTTSYPSADNPAAGIFVAGLARALASSCDVTVVAPGTGRTAAADSADGITVRRVRWAPLRIEERLHGPGGIPAALARQPLNWLFVPFLLIAFAVAVRRASGSADVIHANWAICGWLARVALRGSSTPVVLTLRGADVSRGETKWLDRQLLRYAVRHADAVVCVNSALCAALREIPAKRPPEAIPNGVDQAFLDVPVPAADAERGLRVAAIGSLIPRKGFDTAIEALARLRPMRISLTILGDGAEREQLAQLCTDLGAGKQVALKAPLPPDQIPGFLAGIDVLVCPSRSEGRPNVVVEAMAAARAVIAADIPGMDEIIRDGETGLLFPAGSADALARALERLAGSPDLRVALGRRARKFIRSEGLTWAACQARYLEVYREVTR